MHGPSFALPALPTPVAPVLAPPAPPKRPARPSRVEPPPAPPSMVLTYLRLHWLVILFCGALVGSVLGYAAYSLMPVKYESKVYLRVSSTPFAMATAGDSSKNTVAFTTYVKNIRDFLRSDTVLYAALNDPTYKIANTETLKSQEFPTKFLEEKLVIDNKEGSELIIVSLEGANPDDLSKILDAIVEALMSRVVEKDIDLKKIERDEWLRHENDMKRRLNELAAQGGSASRSSFLPGGMPAPLSPAVAPLAGVESPAPAPAQPVQQAGAVSAAGAGIGAVIEASESVRKMQQTLTFTEIAEHRKVLGRMPFTVAQLRGQIDAAKRKVAEQSAPRAPSAEALELAERSDPKVAEKLYQAMRLERELAQKRAISNDQNSPSIRAKAAEAAQARAEADRVKSESAAKIERQQAQPQLAKAQAELDELQNRLVASEVYEKDIAQKLKQAEADLVALPADPKRPDEKAKLLADPQVTAALTETQAFSRITERRIALDIELKAPKRVSSQPAQKARPASGKKQQIMAGAAVVLGFALVALGSVGYELRARKISSLADLAGQQAAPVVGVVPHTPGAAAIDPMRRADLVEAIDKLRARVCQEWLGRGPATLVVTAPVGEEGQAFTAFRLATSLAQAGLRTLLVDFDLRSPGLHLLAGVPNVGGVADILRGTWDERAGQIVLPSGLSFLPAGEWGAESGGDARPDPLSSTVSLGAALDPMLNKLRANVDCLILAAHPILMSADSVELARRADAVLVCATYRETVGPLAKRACERVAQMSGPAPALVYLGATREEALC